MILRNRAALFASRLLRLAGTVLLTFVGLTAVTFSIGRFIPVDPVIAVVGDHATHEVYEKTRLAMGLDRSIPEQYLIYLGRIVHGDLGQSMLTSQRVVDDLYQYFPATFELATVATLIGVLVGIPAGVIAGAQKGRWPDHLTLG